MIVPSPHFFNEKSNSDRGETARAQPKSVGTPHAHCTGSVRFPLKECGYPMITVRIPYDLRTVLTQNVDESQGKKSYDVRMNCKHICHSPRSLTYSKKTQGK